MTDRFHIALIAPARYHHWRALEDVRDLLVVSLRDLGAVCSFSHEVSRLAGVNIVLGYHLLPSGFPLPPGSVVYQLEQLSDKEGWWSPERAVILRQACQIWDYNDRNVEFLLARGFDRVAKVPIGYHPALERIAHRSEGQKDIDVLFYGSMNDRRLGIIRAVRARGLVVQTAFGCYGTDRDALIARSKVVLNCHYYDAQIPEDVRTSYLLNNRVCVVSESGPITADQLPGLCEQYVRDQAAREAFADVTAAAFRARPMTGLLRAALAGQNQEASCAV